jgi:LacI family transcriptional regulator
MGKARKAPGCGDHAGGEVRRIGLLLPARESYARDTFFGVSRYATLRGRWHLALTDPYGAGRVRAAASVCDGIIATVTGPWLAEALADVRGPVVNVSTRAVGRRFPTVCTDNEAMGRLAAEHLLERGLRHFAAVGGRPDVVGGRIACFQRHLEAVGHTVATWPPPDQQEDAAALQSWLRDLPKPCGVFCLNDHRAAGLLESIAAAGLRVPADLAVLGAGNDELLLAVTPVPLSSLQPDADRVGLLAAELLDRLLAGQTPPAEPTLVPPKGVVVRASTELFAVDDEPTARALAFIAHNATRPVNVADVAAACGITRRSLERRFGRYVGRTVRKQIVQVQLRRACQLLTETDWPLERIAADSGLGRPEHISRIFRREMGTTPTAYRQSHR